MGATKLNPGQACSLVNRMCPTDDFESGAYGQLSVEGEKDGGNQSEGAVAANYTQASCVLRHDAGQPIETVHYAVTGPVQWRGDLGDWRT